MLLLAHRGAPAIVRHENTVAALLDALASGADGAEIDLRLSADGVLVVSHDPGLGRVAASPLQVASTPWPDLRAAAEAGGAPLARVEWALAALAGRPLVLELKAPPPAAGAVERTASAVVELLRSLRSADLPLAVTVSSFAPALLDAVRAHAGADLAGARPLLHTALLGRPGVRPAALLRQALAAGHDQVHPHVAALLLDPGSVRRAHDVGLGVTVWTVNSGRALRRLQGLGVAAVITDVPGTACAALASRRQAA